MNSCKRVFIGFFILISINLHAQSQELKQWLKDTASTIDSVRWDALGNLGYYYTYRQEDSAHYFFEKLQRESIDDDDLLAKSYYWMAIYLEKVNAIDSANHFYRKALRLYEKDTLELITVYRGLGDLYQSFSSLDSILYYYQISMELAQEKGDSSEIAITLSNMANAYTRYNQYEQSMEIRFEILAYAERVNDKPVICVQKLNIGKTLRYLKRYDKAYKYLEEGTWLAEEIDEISYAAFGYKQLGNMAYHQGENDLAIEYQEKSLEMRLQIGDPLRIFESRQPLVELHVRAENWERARILAENNLEALESLSTRLDFNYYEAKTYLTLAAIYIDIDKEDLGLKYLELAGQVSLDKIPRSKELNLIRIFDSIFKKLNRYENAYQTLSRRRELEDSLRNESIQGRILSLETQYETQKKEQQIVLQALQIEQKETQLRSQLVISALIVLVLFGGTFAFYKVNKYKSDKALWEVQQRFLRSQLNLHFISNSLTATQNFLSSNKGDVSDYLGMFGTLMRQILENSRKEFITLEEEISMLEKYFKLQKLRFGDRFDYAIEVDDTLEEDLVKIPPMFAQPFIENSLEHGLFRKEGKNEITLRFKSLDKNLIRLEINDSGTGILTNTKLKVADHTSLSTKITHERLDLMKVVHKQHTEFESENIVSDHGEVIGYKVRITLPGKVMVA